jgi:hypothetical protein
MNLGKLADLRTKRYRLKVRIDGIVKSILVHFEPLDSDMGYVMGLDPGRLAIHVSDMEKLHRELRSVQTEIKRLEDELGENSDQ